ncbi:MAG: CPXCG motif-containing cysteine-rich protein [Pseudomonadota bacterium]
MLETQKTYCPYCGEPIEAVIDTSIEQQEYIEDCSVCCQPIEFRVSVDPLSGAISLEVRTDSE